MGGAIRIIDCRDVENFITALGSNNSLWKKGSRNFWVFRGHEDDSYKLIPSSLREHPKAKLGYTHSPKEGVQSTNKEQIQAEFERLHEFHWLVDAQGLSVPIDGNLLRTPSAFEMLRTDIEKGWPCDKLLPLLALAQHYGVPTRLLDWSENPLAAAYFAALGAVKADNKQKGSPKKYLAVWALNIDWIINEAFPGDSKRKMAVYVVTAPRASNPNLHAQGGIFTTEILTSKEQKSRRRPEIKTVDQIVADRWNSLGLSNPVMAHITLPWREAAKLLRLLNREGVNSATLFPGYQGIADSLKYRDYWDKKERTLYWLPN